MAKTLIVASRVKELAQYKKKPLNISSDLSAELTKLVEKILEEACIRCVANGRSTVMPRDL